MVRGKSYALEHAVAYETTIDDEEVIAVVLSGQTVSSEKLKQVRKADKEGESSEFQPALHEAGVHESRRIQTLECRCRRYVSGLARSW